MPFSFAGTPMVDLFAKYQTFFVGVLGFTGVIITMVVNAKTQRDLQSNQRQHYAQSARTALLAELKANAEMYESRIKDFSASDGVHHTIVPSKVVNRVYQTLLPNIGVLSVEEVELVNRAYLLLEELPYRLRILVGTDNVGGLNHEFVRIDADRQQVAAGIHEAILPSVRNALSALARNA
jgi:hypothetical protein